MSNLIYFKLIKLYLIQLHEGTLVVFENTYNNNTHLFKENTVLHILFRIVEPQRDNGFWNLPLTSVKDDG